MDDSRRPQWCQLNPLSSQDCRLWRRVVKDVALTSSGSCLSYVLPFGVVNLRVVRVELALTLPVLVIDKLTASSASDGT